MRKYKHIKNSYHAVSVAEGFEEADSEAEIIEAWQYIYDRRLHSSLPGFFGRTVSDLVANGIIKP